MKLHGIVNAAGKEIGGCQCHQEERKEIGCPLCDDVKESEGIFKTGRSNDMANELIFDNISGRVRKESIFHPLTTHILIIVPLYCYSKMRS